MTGAAPPGWANSAVSAAPGANGRGERGISCPAPVDVPASSPTAARRIRPIFVGDARSLAAGVLVGYGRRAYGDAGTYVFEKGVRLLTIIIIVVVVLLVLAFLGRGRFGR